jgi:hypothetical protein
MKFVKVFIASAGSLQDERTQLRLRIAELNDELVKQGVYLEVVVWEKLSLSLGPIRKQDEFNAALVGSDIVIGVISDKVGEFTYEEITKAYDSMLDGGLPKKLYLALHHSGVG